MYGVVIQRPYDGRTYIIKSTVGASLRSEIDNMPCTGFWVDSETVGQYTGLKDKNGVKIFEGDIVLCKNYHGKVQGIVDYHNSYFYLACNEYSDEYLFNCSDQEVIGNIHDDSKLLEE